MQEKSRLQWPDVARGAAVLAVVYMHVISKHLAEVSWSPSGPVLGLVEASYDAMAPIRMPLFFLISGVFAAGILRRSWGELLSRRTAKFYYLYVLWLTIQTLVMQLTPDFGKAVPSTVAEYAEQVLISPANPWYLYALAAFFPLAKIGLRAPRLMLAAALVANLLAQQGWLTDRLNLMSLPQNFLWFAVGALFHPHVLRLAANPTARAWVVGLVLYLVPLAVMTAIMGGREPALYTVACIGGATVGVLVSAAVARRVRPLAVVLTRVGARTLSIYVLHIPLLALWHTATAESEILGRIFGGPLALTYPLAMTVVLTAAALGVHRLTAPWLPFLYEGPWLLRKAASSRPSAAEAAR